MRSVVLVLCLLALAGCGSTSTGDESPKAVSATATDFAGADGKLYKATAMVNPADGGKVRALNLVVACKPDGTCEIVAPDGAAYPGLQAMVDDTRLLKAGDEVLGAANITSPGQPVDLKTFTRTGPPWLWIGVGVGLAIVLVAGLLVLLARRRRRQGEKLRRQWESPSGDVEDELGA
jgi:hypothetical protein